MTGAGTRADSRDEENGITGAGHDRPCVLFLCTHNSARSQMAEGYLRANYGHLFEAASAGTKARGVHPVAVAVMKEIGIDIAGHRSKPADEFAGRKIAIVVTVCDGAKEACPFFPGAKERIHAGFPDPSSCNGTPEECLAGFREARDAIASWIDTVFIPRYADHRPVRNPGPGGSGLPQRAD